MLTVPKSKLFLSFFFFFSFVVFFCLHVQLFLLGFVICCNGNLIYPHLFPRWMKLRGLVTCSRWLHRAMGYFLYPEKIQTGDRGDWGHRFSRDLKERAYGKPHGISMGLGFWPWNFPQQGLSHNFAEFAWMKACFIRVTNEKSKNSGLFFFSIVYTGVKTREKIFDRT